MFDKVWIAIIFFCSEKFIYRESNPGPKAQALNALTSELPRRTAITDEQTSLKHINQYIANQIQPHGWENFSEQRIFLIQET